MTYTQETKLAKFAADSLSMLENTLIEFCVDIDSVHYAKGFLSYPIEHNTNEIKAELFNRIRKINKKESFDASLARMVRNASELNLTAVETVCDTVARHVSINEIADLEQIKIDAKKLLG